MPLLDQLQKDLVASMKAREEMRLSAIRMIKTALQKANVIDPAALAVRTIVGGDLNGIDAQPASIRGRPEPVERGIESHRFTLTPGTAWWRPGAGVRTPATDSAAENVRATA